MVDKRVLLICGSLLLLAAPHFSVRTADAQVTSQVSRDTSLAAMIGYIRKGPDAYRKERLEAERLNPKDAQLQLEPAHAASFLMQQLGPQPQAKLDALADSLVVIALEYRKGDSHERALTAERAVLALARSGLSQEIDRNNHTPYTGAFDRLVRIAQEGVDQVVTAAVFRLHLVDRSRSLGFYRDFVTSMNTNAFTAITMLNNERLQPEGREVLRKLYLEGAVKEPTALDILNHMAFALGW